MKLLYVKGRKKPIVLRSEEDIQVVDPRKLIDDNALLRAEVLRQAKAYNELLDRSKSDAAKAARHDRVRSYLERRSNPNLVLAECVERNFLPALLHLLQGEEVPGKNASGSSIKARWNVDL